MAEPTDVPRSWIGQDVVIWARSEGHPFEDAHGLGGGGFDQTKDEFGGRLAGVNDLGDTLQMEDNRLGFFPWHAVARIILPVQ